MSGGFALSWALASCAIAHKLDVMPLPTGSHEAEVGNWRLIVNNSKLTVIHRKVGEADVELPPFEVYCQNRKYLSFGLIGPAGGMLGGYTEDQFILDLMDFLPKSALEPFREELAVYEEMRKS